MTDNLTDEQRALVERLRLLAQFPVPYVRADAVAAAAEIRRLAKRVGEARSEALRDAARACRLYQEWCGPWGQDSNMRAAIEGADECARLLGGLPDSLPEDDEEAASQLYVIGQRARALLADEIDHCGIVVTDD